MNRPIALGLAMLVGAATVMCGGVAAMAAEGPRVRIMTPEHG